MRWAWLLVLLLLPIVSALPGVPNCCPTGLDDSGLITLYEEEGLAFYPEPCDDVCIAARDQYIDRKLARARAAMEKKIADCADGVEFNAKLYADDAELVCNYVDVVMYRPPWDNDAMKEAFDTGSDSFAGSSFADASTYGIEAAMVGDYIAAFEECEYEADLDTCHHDAYWKNYCWIEAYHSARDGAAMQCTVEDEFEAYYTYGKGVVAVGANTDKCSSGMVYNIVTGNCDPADVDTGTVSVTLDSTIYDQTKDDGLTGVVSFSCDDDCTGKTVGLNVKAVDSSMTFEVSYDGDPYVSSSRPVLDFTITVDNYDPVVHKVDPITVEVYDDPASKQTFTFLPGTVGGVLITPSTWTMKQGDTIQLDVAVDGPDLDYIYVFSTALDGSFEFEGNEMPITAVVNGGNKVSVKWTTPLISRVVRAEEFYAAEVGQLSSELLQSAIKGIYLGAFSKYGMQKWGGDVSSGTFNGAVAGTDAVVSLGMEGFVPAGFAGALGAAAGAFGDNGGAAGAVGDVLYKTYNAYSRATERYNVFAETAMHDYPVPITVIVHADGYPQQEDKIKVTVRAPEAIVK